jgi:adenine-specific DNA-methyltransferase
MKVALKEDKSRRIADRQHNIHVASGIDPHCATAIAPPSMLSAFSEDLTIRIANLHSRTEATLTGAIGKPYFFETGFFLYKGDSVELLSALGEKNFEVDLTLTSPPYNIGKAYEQEMTIEAYIEWCQTWMNQIYAVTKPAGAFWLNVGYFQVPGKGLCVPIAYLLWDKSRFYLLQEVVWKYGAGVSAKSRLSPRNEKWLFFVKDRSDYTFNLDDIRDPNVKYPNQKKNGKYRCNPLGKNPSDVWEFPKVTTGSKRSSRERTGHPAQFPLGVVERVILASSNQAQVVFDPFAGSFSAGIAAYGLGRVAVGFEKDEEYCRLAVQRFKNFKEERKIAQSQLELL